MEHVAAPQLLRGPRNHVLSTNDADGVFSDIFRSGIHEILVHVRSDSSVLDERDEPVLEVSQRPVQVPKQVEGEAVIDEDEAEKYGIDSELEELCDQV